MCRSWAVFGHLVDLLFLTDMLISFDTAYWDDGNIITSRRVLRPNSVQHFIQIKLEPRITTPLANSRLHSSDIVHTYSMPVIPPMRSAPFSKTDTDADNSGDVLPHALVPIPSSSPSSNAFPLPKSNHSNETRNLIAREYLRTWFIVDFVSTVPLDTIFSKLLLNADALRGTKLIRMIRLIRLFKIFRLLKVRTSSGLHHCCSCCCRRRSCCCCWGWHLRGSWGCFSFPTDLGIRTSVILLLSSSPC